MKSVVLLLLASYVQCTTLNALLPSNKESMLFRAVTSILTTHSQCEHTTLLLTDEGKEEEAVQAPRGVTVFQMAVKYLNNNATHTNLTATVDKVRQMGQLWQCLVLVVMSDDVNFLVTFAHLSLRRHALRWSMRVFVLTHLPLNQLGGLHGLLSSRNAMLLLSQEDKNAISNEVGVYVWQPYSAPSSTPLRVATWTPHWRLTLAPQMSLFPDKFSVFNSTPILTVGIEFLPHHTLTWVEDSDAPEGRRIVLTGFVDEIVKYLAKAINFKYRYVVSPERTFGTKLPDGSWTGLMGMVVREEVDFAPGPFILNPLRYEAVDPTTVYSNANLRIIGGLIGLKVDPWGFLLPLTPSVWAITLMALLGVLTVLQLLRCFLPGKTLASDEWPAKTFSSVRIIFQQDIVFPAEWWWWERLVLGLWMLTTLLLAKSYAGNLMSLLAVRYIPQPFQTLKDILDNSHVAIIVQKQSNYEQTLRVKSGVFREVAKLEEKGRLKFHTQAQMPKSLDTLVRAGHHIIVDLDVNLRSHMALDFSKNGTGS